MFQLLEIVNTAINFENITSYPYQYVSYERTVTVQVPQAVSVWA